MSESACPFCGAGLGEAFRSVPSRRAPTTRLSRAALFALGATGFTVAMACGSGGGTETGTVTMGGPLYGGMFAPIGDAATPAENAPDVESNPIGAYGCPASECAIPPVDVDAGADGATDALPVTDATPDAATIPDAAPDAADTGTADAATDAPCVMVCASYGLGPGPSCFCE